jgi:hypothetical protein
MALLLMISGCGDDDKNPINPPGDTTMTFVGTVNGLDGILSGSLSLSVVNDSAVTGTFRIVAPAASTHALTGMYEDSSMVLVATGDGYNFGGIYDGTNRLEGGMTGAAMGTFVCIRDENNASVAYCGTFTGSDDGSWNLTIEGNNLYGSYTTTSGDSGLLDGVVSGNTITISHPLGGTPLAVGTRDGNNVSGTWNNRAWDSGSWTGSRCN